MTQFYIFLLFHFNDLALDIRKQVLLLDAKRGCLQNAKEFPELLHKLLVIPSIHMGFTRFNCFRLHGISVARPQPRVTGEIALGDYVWSQRNSQLQISL